MAGARLRSQLQFQAEVQRHTPWMPNTCCALPVSLHYCFSPLNTSLGLTVTHISLILAPEAGIILSPSGATVQCHNPNVLRHKAKSITFMGNHLEGQLRTVFPAAQILLEYKNETCLFRWKTWQKSVRDRRKQDLTTHH